MSALYRVGSGYYDSYQTAEQAENLLGPQCKACEHQRDGHAHVKEAPCHCGCTVDSYVLDALTDYMEKYPSSRLVPRPNCGCPGHTWPGVSHVAPCCDVPHVDFYDGKTL